VNERIGDWMQTFTGKRFWPLDPRANEIDIRDIAHSLSMTCRFGGHTRRFYSVAEHSCHVHDAGPVSCRAWGLLHDAPEFIVGDMARPLKRQLPDYKRVEDGIHRKVAERFGLPYAIPPEVKNIDDRILVPL
jgi:5'-deoxynucleotidase YfbR-like HD superfamily hydrolase